MIYGGWDPGKKGGYGSVDEEGRIVEYGRMPILAKAYDEQAIREFVVSCGHVAIEKVGARPGQGGVSNFTFGDGYGLLRGTASGTATPYTLVLPQTWQKVMLAGMNKDDTKAAAVQRCLQLWPETAEFFRVKANQGASDALLVAEWLRRQNR